MSQAQDIYALALDYEGNVCADMDAVIVSINNPVGLGTTVNASGQVVPKPIEFDTPTTNPYISNALIPPGKKSPYVEPPTLLDIPKEDVPLSVGTASTHRLSPTEPVFIKTTMRTEFDSETNTIKNTSKIVGIGSTGTVIFSEEKTSDNLTLNSNLEGNVTGNVLAGIVTSGNVIADSITADGAVVGIFTATDIVTSTLETTDLVVNGETLNFSITQVNTQNFLTISVPGVGSTSIELF